ncbi:MAG TPA: hypothetical protein VHC73_08380 [Vitreimonas sp.]|nr:hypothetical protein [Vitreimonas sp.]
MAAKEDVITAYDVAAHVEALSGELATMARGARLFELAALLERTQRVARAQLYAEEGKAAPEDAA